MAILFMFHKLYPLFNFHKLAFRNIYLNLFQNIIIVIMKE